MINDEKEENLKAGLVAVANKYNEDVESDSRSFWRLVSHIAIVGSSRHDTKKFMLAIASQAPDPGKVNEFVEQLADSAKKKGKKVLDHQKFKALIASVGHKAFTQGLEGAIERLESAINEQVSAQKPVSEIDRAVIALKDKIKDGLMEAGKKSLDAESKKDEGSAPTRNRPSCGGG